MRVVMISKALVVGAYQRKLEAIAGRGVDLTVIVPPRWRERRVGTLELERSYTEGYRMAVLPMVRNGDHHLHFYRGLDALLSDIRPDVVHVDEESFNLVTFLAFRSGLRLGARCCFYNWANIERRYPPPFRWFERYVLGRARYALAGNAEAAAIIRAHGYGGELAVIPQFGVNEPEFRPLGALSRSEGLETAFYLRRPEREAFNVGFLGRLVPEKGVLDLVDALPLLPSRARAVIVGQGALEHEVRSRARRLGVADRVDLLGAVPSLRVPEVLRGLDALVVPSRTTPRWKEQFGRVIPEAMCCGVPVVGANSGEIPRVIGDAGLVVREGSVVDLAAALGALERSREYRAELATRGRRRVLDMFTQDAIAGRCVEVYEEMVAS